MTQEEMVRGTVCEGCVSYKYIMDNKVWERPANDPGLKRFHATCRECIDYRTQELERNEVK
jgi:ribosomal protein L32